MNAITYTDLRKNLKTFMDQVYDDHEPIIVTRKNNQNLILISIEDYNSLLETDYLLSNSANEKRLLESLAKARTGKSFYKDIIE